MNILPLIRRRTARIGVIGLGGCGLPLAVAAARAGYSVTGFDLDPEKRSTLDSGSSYVKNVSPDDLKEVRQHFDWSIKFNRLGNMNVIAICVQEPSGNESHTEITPAEIGEIVGTYVKLGTLILLKDSACPEQMTKALTPVLARRSLIPGKDVFIGRRLPGSESNGNPRTDELIDAFYAAIETGRADLVSTSDQPLRY